MAASRLKNNRRKLVLGPVIGCLILGGAACSSAKSAGSTPPATRGSSGAGSSPAATSTAAGVTAVPVSVAKTSDGPVGYRQIGHGPPLVLIMGFGGTMNDWAPDFVDSLAAGHRVVIFDNAGIGRTGSLPSPLTVTAMADQTSALISALGLGRADVLGWSMGGMIAQALAVQHPGQVNHLVLAATQPGTGRSLPIPAAAAAEVSSGNPASVLTVLFPPGEQAAVAAYVAGILQYQPSETPPGAVMNAQIVAIGQWLEGNDPSGAGTARIASATLVADGTEDALDPVANDHILAATIAGAHLVLYGGAGHAFLFQDSAQFLPVLEQFLS
jgi:pimeloyl-ACP methyl ester carboxylesterase